MTNDNDLLLLASSQNIKTFEVYIDSNGRKTLTPQTKNYTAKHIRPYVCKHAFGTAEGLLANEKPKKVIFPNCSEITGQTNTSITANGAFERAFEGCTSLTSVSFPALTIATGGTGGSSFNDGAFEGAFRGCTSLTSVSFPALTSTTSGSADIGVFKFAFEGCTSLTSVSFPALTRINGDSFWKAFIECSPSLKVHFKKSMEGTTGLGYASMGLTSADQVVFDLP